MDDHFWPSIYPGLIVGLLIGLSGGTMFSAILGALGGLAGALAYFYAYTAIGFPEGLLQLIGLIMSAVIGANLAMFAARRLARLTKPASGDDKPAE